MICRYVCILETGNDRFFRYLAIKKSENIVSPIFDICRKKNEFTVPLKLFHCKLKLYIVYFIAAMPRSTTRRKLSQSIGQSSASSQNKHVAFKHRVINFEPVYPPITVIIVILKFILSDL